MLLNGTWRQQFNLEFEQPGEENQQPNNQLQCQHLVSSKFSKFQEKLELLSKESLFLYAIVQKQTNVFMPSMLLLGSCQGWKSINCPETTQKQQEYNISAGAGGGPRSRVCARWTLHSAPIHTSGRFPAHVSAESPSNISPNPFNLFLWVRSPCKNFRIL